MMRYPWRLTISLGAAAGGCLLFAATATADGPADPAAKLFTEVCSPCHTPTTRPLDAIRKTPEQWQETLDRMIDLGAEVPKARKAELLDYLNRMYGPGSPPPDPGKK